MTEKNKLISRIVDRDDRPEDWTTLDGVAKQDPRTWRELLFALRDDAEVRHVVGAQLVVADTVALPSTPAAARNGWGTAAVLAAAGWLAAAVLAVLWLGSTLLWGDALWGELPAGTSEPAAGAVTDFIRAPDAGQGPARAIGDGVMGDGVMGDGVMGDGVMRGRVMSELPRLMVQARPIAGREEIEVIYVRRTLERVLVKKAYRLTVDESGQPFTVPADLTDYMPPRIY